MAIVVNSGLFGQSYAFIRSKSSLRKVIARLFNQRSMQSDRELAVTLLGAAAGGAALADYARVQADQDENGGLRVIEMVDLVDRVTTAGDITDLTDNILEYDSQINAYPVDKATRP